ncbi:MAG: hypothetical protein ACOXZ0_08215 [Eubacteriales bacterium]|jgi:hypothetical protein
MEVLKKPFYDKTKKISYEMIDEQIICTYNGKTDVFDFAGLPDGEADVSKIETILDMQPILSAVKEKGRLRVEVINFYGDDAGWEETDPLWIQVS